MDYKEYERTFPGNFLRHLCSHNLLLKFDSKSTEISSEILKCNPKITKVRSEKYKSAVLTVYLKALPNEQPANVKFRLSSTDVCQFGRHKNMYLTNSVCLWKAKNCF